MPLYGKRCDERFASFASFVSLSSFTSFTTPYTRRDLDMSAYISVWGRLGMTPETRQTKADKTMANARLAVAFPVPYGAEEGTPEPLQWFSVLAFGRMAEGLSRHQKGECLSVAGRLELRRYQTVKGDDGMEWKIIADSIIGPRTARPKGNTGKDSKINGIGSTAPFDDSLPF